MAWPWTKPAHPWVRRWYLRPAADMTARELAVLLMHQRTKDWLTGDTVLNDVWTFPADLSPETFFREVSRVPEMARHFHPAEFVS